MRISSRGRYALASMIFLAQNVSTSSVLTVLHISEKLNISKIYLEQVFSILRKGGLVNSTKGPQGGYQLAKETYEISAADILDLTESALFEDTDDTVGDSSPGIERALQGLLFKPLNIEFKAVLDKILLSDLTEESLRQSANDGYMYYL